MYCFMKTFYYIYMKFLLHVSYIGIRKIKDIVGMCEIYCILINNKNYLRKGCYNYVAYIIWLIRVYSLYLRPRSRPFNRNKYVIKQAKQKGKFNLPRASLNGLLEQTFYSRPTMVSAFLHFTRMTGCHLERIRTSHVLFTYHIKSPQKELYKCGRFHALKVSFPGHDRDRLLLLP